MNKQNYRSILIYVILIMGMAFHINASTLSFSVESIVLFLISLIALCAVFILGEDVILYKIKSDLVVRLAQALIIWNLLCIIFKVIAGLNGNVSNYSYNLILMGLCILLVILSKGYRIDETFLSILFYAGMVVILLVLVNNTYTLHMLVDRFTLLTNPDSAASVLMLFILVATYLYVYCTDKYQEYMYILGIALGSFALILVGKGISHFIMLLALILMPILLVPTANTIRKTGIITGVYMLILSNIPLVPILTDSFKLKERYTLEASISLDFLLIILGIVYFHFYDKVPKDADMNRLVLCQMHKVYIYVFMLLTGGLTAILIAGDKIGGIDGASWANGVKSYGLIITNSIKNSSTLLHNNIVNLDAISFIGLIIVLTILVYMAWGNYKDTTPTKTMGIIIYSVFMIEMMTMDIPAVTQALYLLFGIYAVYGIETEKNYVYKKYVEDIKEEK